MQCQRVGSSRYSTRYLFIQAACTCPVVQSIQQHHVHGYSRRLSVAPRVLGQLSHAARLRQQQQQPLLQQAATVQQRRVHTQAVQVDLLLGGLSGASGWVLGAVLLAGVLLGLTLAKLATNYLRKQIDPYYATLENAELRAKVEELQQLLLKLEPLAYNSMRLKFTKGINKRVVLGMIDKMLENKEVNIWWLPDQIERVFYFNMMTLMLSVLDEVVDGMSISLAGHNVRLQLTYLDVAQDGEATSKAAKNTEALLQHAMQPPKTYSGQDSTQSTSPSSSSSSGTSAAS